MCSQTTKQALIESGVQFLLEKGYNDAGLKEILEATGVPKGSFYHFFPSKQAFGLEVIDAYSKEFERVLQNFLVDSNTPALERMRRFFKAMIKRFEQEQQCKGGCLVGNLAQELADVNETFQTRIGSVLDSWQRYFENCLKDAKSSGEVSHSLKEKELAEFIIDSWEGAVMRMKVTATVQPLRNCVTHIFKLLEET